MTVFTEKNGLPNYHILHDYHALRESGNRPLSAIKLGVIHDMENPHYNTAAEEVGHFFEMAAAQGSSHYGDDNNSIQQYLYLHQICWGAPYANYQGVHIEQMGLSSWSEQKWLNDCAGMLDRTAFLIARLNVNPDIKLPIRLLTVDQVKRGMEGWITHRIATKAFGGTHTDPGTGYPLTKVLGKAQYYAKLMKES
jgi:hypothetical protein